MKELSIEEKAKAYDEAIKYAQYLINERCKENTDGSFHRADLNRMFPKLVENEDERIRKALIDYFRWNPNSQLLNEFSNREVFAWLEKQGKKTESIEGFNTEFERQISHLIASTINKEYEYTKDFVKWASDALLKYAKHELEKQSEQKPKFRVGDTIKCKYDNRQFTIKSVDLDKGTYTYTQEGCGNDIDYADKEFELVEQKPAWSEEDERNISKIIEILHYTEKTSSIEPISLYSKEINWLKSLRPQNWTKKDKERYISCLQRLSTGNPEQPETINSKWFKGHVYPQSTWKPSLAQMNALSIVSKGNAPDDIEAIVSLYNDLKKLKS